MTETPTMHPAVTATLRWFAFEHLAPGLGREVSEVFASLARDLAGTLTAAGTSDPEVTYALRALLVAKDAAVRAALVADGVVT